MIIFNKEKVKYSRSSRRNLERVKQGILNSGNKYCLDVGCGITPENGCKTLDFQKLPYKDQNDQPTGKWFTPDYLIDVKAIFAPGYCEDKSFSNQYPDKDKLKYNYWDFVNMTHFVEHIEWIYQDFLFEWVFSLLNDGGVVYIATPNLEYILGVYEKNRKYQKRGKPVKYPVHEHPYLTQGVSHDMQRWVQYKLYSGCSPKDYHHCHYDAYLLSATLLKAGFTKVSISSTDTLICMAYKPGEAIPDVEESIKRTVE